jgi:hypothetical protein
MSTKIILVCGNPISIQSHWSSSGFGGCYISLLYFDSSLPVQVSQIFFRFQWKHWSKPHKTSMWPKQIYTTRDIIIIIIIHQIPIQAHMKLHTIKDTKRIFIITIKYKIIKNAFALFMIMNDNICALLFCIQFLRSTVEYEFKVGKIVIYKVQQWPVCGCKRL